MSLKARKNEKCPSSYTRIASLYIPWLLTPPPSAAPDPLLKAGDLGGGRGEHIVGKGISW